MVDELPPVRVDRWDWRTRRSAGGSRSIIALPNAFKAATAVSTSAASAAGRWLSGRRRALGTSSRSRSSRRPPGFLQVELGQLRLLDHLAKPKRDRPCLRRLLRVGAESTIACPPWIKPTITRRTSPRRFIKSPPHRSCGTRRTRPPSPSSTMNSRAPAHLFRCGRCQDGHRTAPTAQTEAKKDGVSFMLTEDRPRVLMP